VRFQRAHTSTSAEIKQIDDGRVMYERPTNQFVREFVGRSVMLHGVLKSRDGVALRPSQPASEARRQDASER
jgi:ABC-type Fe3+/spermidine/putrescine transport system ATPase subunit